MMSINSLLASSILELYNPLWYQGAPDLWQHLLLSTLTYSELLQDVSGLIAQQNIPLALLRSMIR